MKKNILILLLIFTAISTMQSQTKGVKIGYIDMEYILQNVPEYIEAKNQLEEKAQKWKQEIEIKKAEIANLKEALKTEQVLLTKELYEERKEEIAFQEKELLDYQQKRFGANGDLAIQKAILAQPIQDQVFNSVQDIAEAKKYDFIFDKSSDLTMLFTAKRYDISDQVVRAITRSSKRNQQSKKELKAQEAADAKLDADIENPTIAERQKKLDERKAARDKLIEERKLASEEKKLAAQERQQQLLLEREAKKNGTTVVKESETITEVKKDGKTETETVKTESISTENTAKSTTNNDAAVAKQKLAEERAQILAERKKALEEKKKKALEEREAAKKAKEQKIQEQKAQQEQKQTEVKTN